MVASDPTYDPKRVVSDLMRQLLAERVPISVRSAGAAYEAAERLLRTLGVASTDDGDLAPVVPLRRAVAQ